MAYSYSDEEGSCEKLYLPKLNFKTINLEIIQILVPAHLTCCIDNKLWLVTGLDSED